MASKRDSVSAKKGDKTDYFRINLYLYGALLFATPFIMLQLYLQDFVCHLSSVEKKQF